VLKELAWFADDDGANAWPSVKTLAERTGLSRRGIQKILRDLEQLGAIEAVGTRLGGRHRTTRYRLVLGWFEADLGAKKGEQGDSETANGSARKGEPGSPEQNEHEIEKKKNPISDKGKDRQAKPYEQQRQEQEMRTAIRKKTFPEPLSGERFYAKKQEVRAKLAEFAKRRPRDPNAEAGEDRRTVNPLP
jgi:hypothetical protein